jgi:hypothetical protein
MKPDYFKEFWLNLDNQLKDFKPKKIMQVGYMVDNCVCFTLMIPKRMWIR